MPDATSLTLPRIRQQPAPAEHDLSEHLVGHAHLVFVFVVLIILPCNKHTRESTACECVHIDLGFSDVDAAATTTTTNVAVTLAGACCGFVVVGKFVWGRCGDGDGATSCVCVRARDYERFHTAAAALRLLSVRLCAGRSDSVRTEFRRTHAFARTLYFDFGIEAIWLAGCVCAVCSIKPFMYVCVMFLNLRSPSVCVCARRLCRSEWVAVVMVMTNVGQNIQRDIYARNGFQRTEHKGLMKILASDANKAIEEVVVIRNPSERMH